MDWFETPFLTSLISKITPNSFREYNERKKSISWGDSVTQAIVTDKSTLKPVDSCHFYCNPPPPPTTPKYDTQDNYPFIGSTMKDGGFILTIMLLKMFNLF